MREISLYLAGSIRKGHEQTESQWTQAEIDFIKGDFPYIRILNPGYRFGDVSDPRSVFGRDLTQVYLADAVFVDARSQRDLVVGAEMMWAKFHQKPVVTLAPENSHYNRKEACVMGQTANNVIHPFVLHLSDYIALSIHEGVFWLQEYFDKGAPIKGIDAIQEDMRYYRDTQYSQDKFMQDLFSLEVLQEI